MTGPVVTLSKSLNFAPVCLAVCLHQRSNGKDIPVAQTKTISHRRFAASFNLKEVTSQDQDLYRCVTQSGLGSGVSNFAHLFVKGESYFSFWGVLIYSVRNINLVNKKWRKLDIYLQIYWCEDFGLSRVNIMLSLNNSWLCLTFDEQKYVCVFVRGFVC